MFASSNKTVPFNVLSYNTHVILKSCFSLIYHMYKELKYALDWMFIFMLFVSITLYIIELIIPADKEILAAIEGIDLAVLGGYYAFFIHGMCRARKKWEYCKQHWLLIILLTVPLVPIARFARFAKLERLAAIGTDTLWHFLDELELL